MIWFTDILAYPREANRIARLLMALKKNDKKLSGRLELLASLLKGHSSSHKDSFQSVTFRNQIDFKSKAKSLDHEI